MIEVRPEGYYRWTKFGYTALSATLRNKLMIPFGSSSEVSYGKYGPL
jgi:hypothetical protein